MRLINCHTMQLEEYLETEAVNLKYAILSHKWGKEEITFQEMQHGQPLQKQGYIKVEGAARTALARGLSYLWADTCCINKADPTELGEAITSMFRWYKNADICYAHLADVNVSKGSKSTQFSNSAWFTRGWTLQELIAPQKIEFYDTKWQLIGNKRNLVKEIASITRVDSYILQGADLNDRSVAQRMSWAAGRKTSRIEDAAYSLMGLFNVHMKMNYGEGENAFFRLQTKILKTSRDQSIFAWRPSTMDETDCQLLAPSPSYFAGCHNIRRTASLVGPKSSSITNMGLKIQLPLIPWALRTYLGILNCRYVGENSRLAIFLKPLRSQHTYIRCLFKNEAVTAIEYDMVMRYLDNALFKLLREEKIFLQQNWSGETREEVFGLKFGNCPLFDLPGFGKTSPYIYTRGSWNEEDRTIEMPYGTFGTAAVMHFPESENPRLSYLTIKIGFDGNGVPGIRFARFVTYPPSSESLFDWSSPHSGITSQEMDKILDPSWILAPKGWQTQTVYGKTYWLHSESRTTTGVHLACTVQDARGDRIRFNDDRGRFDYQLSWERFDRREMWVFRILESSFERDPGVQHDPGEKLQRSTQIQID